MGKEKKIEWKTAAIPEDTYEKVQRTARKFGYTSISGFVQDAVRRRLEELEPTRVVAEVPA